MDKITEGEQNQQEKFPRSEKIEAGSDGWLSPKGDYYKVGTTEHDESAEYIIKNSVEVKSLEQKVIDSVGQRKSYDERPYREKLRQLGFVLIRGEILRSEDAPNYTVAQLDAISRVGIKTVSAFDGSVEYHSDRILEKIREIIANLQNGPIVKYIQTDIDRHKDLPWIQKIRAKTLDDIREFSRNPFNTQIHIEEPFNPETHDIISSRILDLLSVGYTDEVTIELPRLDYTFRVAGLNGEKLLLQRVRYTHDEFLRTENRISILVVDDLSLKKKFAKLLEKDSKSQGALSKIKFVNQDGYFAEILTGLISNP